MAMDAQVRAGIDLYGSALRYAEVEQYDEQHRLLRLGSCDFDFDVTETLLKSGTEEEIEAVTEALTDIYDGSAAQEVRVVVHPPHVHSFAAPAPEAEGEEARRARFRQEAALLTRGEGRFPQARTATGAPSLKMGLSEETLSEETLSEENSPEDLLHLVTDDLYTESPAENGDENGDERRAWFHVLALPEAAQVRFEDLLGALPPSAFDWTISMKAAARAAASLMQGQDRAAPPGAPAGEEAPYALAVGRYAEHLELALCRDWRWRFGLHAPTAAPADSAYYAAALLDQLGLARAAVGRIFLYGQHAEPEAFSSLERLFGAAPERFDFQPLLDLDPHSIAADFDTGVYVPCIGAAL